MSSSTLKFNRQDKPEFIKELRKRVNAYFRDNNISQHANFNMKFKTGVMLALYFVPLILMLTGVVTGLWPVMAMWAVMGFGMSGIGTSIMHDANHGAYSSNKRVNEALGYLLNFCGGYHINWRIQHNVLHHSYTNIDGHDEDIDPKVMRFSPTQKRYGIFRFQVFYAPFFYGIMSLYWYLGKDFMQITRYNRENLLEGQGIKFGAALTEMIINKIWYAG